MSDRHDDKKKAHYLESLRKQLQAIYGAAGSGLPAPLAMQHRCEGFMQAGLLLGIVSQEELRRCIEAAHRALPINREADEPESDPVTVELPEWAGLGQAG